MININESKAKIAILFRDNNISDDEIDNLYEDFINHMNTNISERLGKRLFEKPQLLSDASGEKTGEIEAEHLEKKFFRTRTYITKAKDLVDVMREIKNWRSEYKNKNISVEVLINNIGIPLYLRGNKYLPPDTYYHLNIIRDFEASFVEEINKQISEE